MTPIAGRSYFGHHQARDWFARVAAHPAIRNDAVRLFVAPTYLQILPAVEAFAGTGVLVAAQDVAADEPGPYTGEVSAASPCCR